MIGSHPRRGHLPRVRAACRVVMSLSDGAVHDETREPRVRSVSRYASET